MVNCVHIFCVPCNMRKILWYAQTHCHLSCRQNCFVMQLKESYGAETSCIELLLILLQMLYNSICYTLEINSLDLFVSCPVFRLQPLFRVCQCCGSHPSWCGQEQNNEPSLQEQTVMHACVGCAHVWLYVCRIYIALPRGMRLRYATLDRSDLVSDPVSRKCHWLCVWHCTVADHFVYMVHIYVRRPPFLLAISTGTSSVCYNIVIKVSHTSWH